MLLLLYYWPLWFLVNDVLFYDCVAKIEFGFLDGECFLILLTLVMNFNSFLLFHYLQYFFVMSENKFIMMFVNLLYFLDLTLIDNFHHFLVIISYIQIGKT